MRFDACLLAVILAGLVWADAPVFDVFLTLFGVIP